MRDELPELLPLICPRCRTRTERGREMHTVSLAEVIRRDEAGAVRDGRLRCDNPACRQSYPIVDGIPLVLPDLATYLAREIATVIEADLPPETAALLAAPGPDEAPWPRLLEHLSIYLDAHWGDRATPPPDGPGEPFGMHALGARLAARAAFPVERAIDLGCSVGRGVAELARGARLTVGLDLHAGALRRARRLLAGEKLPYARRITGRHYAAVTTEAGDLARIAATAIVGGSALDPPLAPGSFDRVSALNLLDSVHHPMQLLSVADGLLAPGGELLIACPYAFQSGIVDDSTRPDTADPAGYLTSRLTRGEELEARYTIEEETNLPWTLRRDARSVTTYSVHYVRAQKQ